MKIKFQLQFTKTKLGKIIKTLFYISCYNSASSQVFCHSYQKNDFDEDKFILSCT